MIRLSFHFKKKYGQNFLVDGNIISKITSDIDLLPNSLCLEIGAGDGRLTKELCKTFNFVLGYEIDKTVEENLYNNLKESSNYKIIFDDFLKRDIKEDLKGIEFDHIYVIANLPYYITTPIIEKIINENLDITLMRLMVQKEVGERFCAVPGKKEYGSITVYLNYFFDIKKEFIVKRNSFIPVPNVDSMVLSFYKKANREVLNNEELFFNLVRDSFQFKRKTLRNNLKNYDLDKITTVLKKYHLDLSIRAEALPLEVFCDIVRGLSI